MQLSMCRNDGLVRRGHRVRQKRAGSASFGRACAGTRAEAVDREVRGDFAVQVPAEAVGPAMSSAPGDSQWPTRSHCAPRAARLSCTTRTS